MAKPDNREDNPARLQNAIDHTIANLHEAEDYLDEHADEITSEEKQSIESKNERRKESINGFIEEKKDESNSKNQARSHFHNSGVASLFTLCAELQSSRNP